MQKHKNIICAIVVTCILIVSGIAITGYINDIKGELTTTTERICELKEVNSNQTKKINELSDKLDKSEKKNSELEKDNESLQEEVTSLKKEVKEKVYPTQFVNIGSRGTGTPVQITMTFYGDFAHENGGYAGIDANGNKLIEGTVASNYYPQGTQFEFNGRIYTVRDRGGSSFNNANRLDIFVPRLNNESNSDYAKRIRHYGVKKVTMYKR